MFVCGSVGLTMLVKVSPDIWWDERKQQTMMRMLKVNRLFAETF